MGDSVKNNAVEENMSKKKVEEKHISKWICIPFILVFIVIPFIVEGKTYQIGLNEYGWYSTNTTSYDFFLYWKSRLIMVTGLLSALILAWNVYISQNQKGKNRRNKGETIEYKILFWLPLCLYGIFTFLSAVFSENINYAFWGSAEQFEGAFVLISYFVLAFYGLYFVSRYALEEKIVSWIVWGTLIVSFIGALQFMNLDFYRTGLAKGLMTLLDSNLAGKDFTFSFALGRTYATLYNPNYVGSYVALLLPFAVIFFVIGKETWKKVLAVATTICLILSLVGSESMTGYIAIFIMAILLIIMLIPFMKKYAKRFLICGASVVIVFVILIVVKKDAFSYGMNKIFHPIKNNYTVSSVEAKKGEGLTIYTKDRSFNVKMEAANGKANFTFTDGNGQELPMTYDEQTKQIKIAEKGYEGFAFTATIMQVNNKSMAGFKMQKDGKTWNFVDINGTYQFLSNYGKAVPIRQIDAFGFENLQHFASRRGFIWSRTIPLIGKHLFIGSGPDTFVLEFPNDDFVGMVNNDYSGNMVTKPHNMYMQIAVQTGVISLIAFLVLYFVYFIDCIRLYWKREPDCMVYIGMACMLGTFGYMVTGLANDSTVTVAPIFWCLLGVGSALNYKIRRRETLQQVK